MAQVLLIEDDAAMSASLVGLLEAAGHAVEAAPSAELGLEDARRRVPELVLLDLNLPGRSGLQALPELLALAPRPAVVVITAQPTAENAIDAMALGATAHLAKPVAPDELARAVADALATHGPRAEAEGDGEAAADERLVGTSAPMLELGRRLGALARSDVSVLILGESGTGKELAARAIHRRSARGAGPFCAVSCAALPEQLLEAELFGHERGAFTGAHQARPGRIELAAGGTLFLDEVGELTPPAQAKLLRFLEERTFERVGGGASRPADVRVLAATNAALDRRVAEGSFREDLYYRLDVVRLELPPLRQRREDVPLLVEHFLARAGRPDVRVHAAAGAALASHPWPGNVRELRNAVAAALVALGAGPELRPEHLPPLRRAAAPPPAEPLAEAVRALVAAEPDPAGDEGGEGASATRSDAEGLHARVKAAVERELISAALARTGQNQLAAARLLGMNRATFRRKMSELELG